MKLFYASISVIGNDASSGILQIEAKDIAEALMQVRALHIGWATAIGRKATINVLSIGEKKPRGKVFELSCKGFGELVFGTA